MSKINDLTHYLVLTYGLLAVFILMVVESCGIPFPSEVIMPFAGFLAATGNASLPLAIVLGALGNLVGSLIAYALAARWGTPLLLGPGRRVGIREDHLELAGRWFERHGLVAVLVGRVLPVIRTYISFPAGLARVEPVRFSVLTFVGALPWCAALAIAGYEVKSNWETVAKPIGTAAIVIAVLVLGLLVTWFLRGRTAAARHSA